MAELRQQIWNDLSLLKNPASRSDTFIRQRRYLEQKLNREPTLSEEKRQRLLKMFNLDDTKRPPDVSEEDTFVGFVDRALSTGVEQAKSLYHGIRGRHATATGDGDLLIKSRRGVQDASEEMRKIGEIQAPYTDNAVEQFAFDAVSALPVMSTALVASVATTKGLVTIGIPTLLAGIIGYGFTDALLEGGGTFADVITHPDMMKELGEVIGREPTEEDLKDITAGVGKILDERASDAGDRTAIAQLFNPLNILESRMKYLGGGGLIKRMVKSGIFVQAPEETTQSLVSQAAREAAIREVDPLNQPSTGVEGLYQGFTKGDIDYGQALYEGAIGAVTGPVVAAPQIYHGIQQERKAEAAKLALEEAKLAEEQEEKIKTEMRDLTLDYLVDGDFESIDRMYTGENTTEAQKEVILGVVKEAKRSENGAVAANAKKYRAGEHIPEDSRTESMRQKNRPMPSSIKSWEFAEAYALALESVQSEEHGLGKATDIERHMVKYATMVENPTLKGFKRSWNSVKAMLQEQAPTPKEKRSQPEGSPINVGVQTQNIPSLQDQKDALNKRTQSATPEQTTTVKIEPTPGVDPNPDIPIVALTVDGVRYLFPAGYGIDYSRLPQEAQDSIAQRDKELRERDTETAQFLQDSQVGEAFVNEEKLSTPVTGQQPQAKPATSETIKQATQEIQESLQQPALSPEGLISKKEAEASIRKTLKAVLGEDINRIVGERLKNVKGKTTRQQVSVESAFNIEASARFPRKGSSTRLVPGQGRKTKGKEVNEQLYSPEIIRNVVIDTAITLRDQGKITASELERIRQAFDGAEFTAPAPPQEAPAQADTITPSPIEKALVDSGIDPSSFSQTISKPIAKAVLKNAGYSDAEADALIPNKETFTVQDLISSEKTQGTSEEASPQDDIPPELSKEFLSSGLARKAVLEYITTGNPSLSQQITDHVKEQMRKEAKKPEGESELDLKALTDSRIVDNHVNLHRTRMMEDYLEAVRETGEVQDNYYPQAYFATGTIRNVFNAMYHPQGGAIGLKGNGLKDSEYNANKEARMEFMSKRVKDPKFKGPKSLNKEYLDNLKTEAAKDKEGRPVISDEEVIMKAGAIPEGAIIQRITTGSKKNTVTFFQFTGMDKKEGDLEPGMWVAVASRGGQWSRITKDHVGQTRLTNVPDEMRPELFKEMHRVNLNDKQGINMANAYLQLTETGETNVKVGDSMYSIEGGGKFNVPDPTGAGYSGPLTDAEKEMDRRYKENIKTRRKFDQARMAIAAGDVGADSPIDKLQKEISRYFEMKGLPLGRDAVTFGSNTVDIVTSEGNVNDPIFQEGIDFFQFKELERGPYQSPTGKSPEGLVLVKFGPPAKVEKPHFEERKPAAPEEEKFDGDLYGRWMNGKWVIMGGIARANIPGQGDTLMYDPDKIDQVPDQYKALFTNFKKAKSSDKGPGKIVADAPKWMKDEIENGRGLLSKEAMIRTVNMGVIPELSLPEHLRTNENDTEAMTNAKRKINEALWEATSEQHLISIGKGADNKEGASLQNRAPITALYAALTALRNPNTANAALATHLGVKSAAQNRQMSTEEMRDEIQRLEELQQTLPELQKAVTEALNELADAQSEAIQIQDLLKIMESNLDERIQEAGEALATGEIDYPEFIKRVNTAKKNFSNQGEGFLNKIDQADAEKTAEEKKAQAADLLKQLEDITVNLESMRAQYQRMQDQAVEEASKNSVEPAPDDPVQTLKDTYGLQDADEIDSETVKDQDLVTMSSAAKSFQQAIYSLMKGRTGDRAPKGVPKPNDLMPILQNYYTSQEGRSKLVGFKRKSYQGKPGVYVQSLMSGKTPKQWVLNLANTWINENTQTPLTEAEFKMTKDFTPEDILGADYKNPSENQGRDDFLNNKMITLSELGGRYKLNERQVEEIDRALDEADFSFYADGFDLQSIVTSEEYSWEKPSNWKEAGDDSVYKAIRQAVDSNIIPQSKKDAIADGIFNDIKQMLKLYLNGVASYGYTNKTGFEENQTALDIGAITREEYGKIDSQALKADRELGKKKI